MLISDTLPQHFSPSAVALGFFDGVHRGHQAVISSAVNCRCDGLCPVILTFKNSPAATVTGCSPSYITTNAQKHVIFESLGTERLFELSFESVRDYTAEEFVQHILFERLNAKKVFCGFNYHFGAGRQGDFALLKKICSTYDIEAFCTEPVEYKSIPISSTRIRRAIECGDIPAVNDMLGRCFSVNLPVCVGNKLGRELGFPTLNQPLPAEFVNPKFGVYASAYVYQGDFFCAVTNIGTKPTIGKYKPLAETWVINSTLQQLYGHTAEILLLDFLREEKRFDNLEQLREQVYKDKEYAEKIYLQAISTGKIITK